MPQPGLSWPTHRPQEPRPVLHTVQILGLAQPFRSARGLSPYFTAMNGLQVVDVYTTRSGAVIVKSYDPKTVEKLQLLKHRVDPELKITAIQRQQTNTTKRKPPRFSCVVKDVDTEISIDDVKEAIQAQGLSFVDAWRIRSRAAGGRDTRLVRVLTEDARSQDALLTKGLRMWGHIHKVEESHAPKPQPAQCRKCQLFHEPGKCNNELTCRLCSGRHHETQCTKKKMCCVLCNGEHAASSYKCTRRPKVATSVAETAPLRLLPSSHKLEEDDIKPTVDQMLCFTATVMLDAFPTERRRMATTLKSLAESIFQRYLIFSYVGNSVHVTCEPIQPQSFIIFDG